ncbi:rhomboid family intramembrane serine protease [Cochlodiniinecator piscidefendens]|uniref:rhomboid family intramembrane serine protease n=1 Tax=Cochlodiniinecator piscidefendens TaxID=2715756 RepID=UPI00140DD789|nr:rhomboid family intramembrane serine protease [Cochlodiniinecator piscidefendens]
MSNSENISPVNPLPIVVVGLAMVMFAVEVVLGLGASGMVGGADAVGWRLGALETYGMPGELQSWIIANGQYRGEFLLRYLTYPFIQISFTSMLFVCVFLLALGKMVGELFSPISVLIIFFTSAIVGAIAYGTLGVRAPLIGGFPAVYGLIGAYTFLLWVNLTVLGGNRGQAFTLIGFLLGVQLLFGLLFGGGYDWVADFAGFGTGFVLSFIVSPGGWGRVVAQLRRR